jgi:hypothetical protein
MKNTLITLAVLCMPAIVIAQQSVYEKAMEKNIAAIQTSQSVEAMQDLVNAFERIAEKESNEWLPDYYAAKLLIDMSFRTQAIAQKDKNLDKAVSLIKRSALKNGDAVELSILEAYAQLGYLAADPVNRGQTLSPLIMQMLGKAIQMDSQNPRALLLMAQMEFGTAQFFGTGTERPCQMADKSLQLFDANTEPVGIKPSWGKEIALQIKQNCK